MQIPVLNGIYTDENSDFRNSYPRNLIPVPKDNGISAGYLRPADGITEFAIGAPGADRGGINWEGICYRVMGNKFVGVSEGGVITEIGDVGTGEQVRLDYSFDYLGVNSGTDLYLYDGITLTQVTDPDLGDVKDFLWIDGYFMTTDGSFLVVTELNDPFAVNPTKYGSSEIDPDPIIGLQKLRNEVYALNANTIEVFENVGGLGFPFRRINGAQIPRGVVGTHASTIYLESLAFIGGGRNEAPSVWLGRKGQSQRIATREIDQILRSYTDEQLSKIVCEARVDKGHQLLYIHFEDRTIVYDGAASQVVGDSVWFTLGSTLRDDGLYLARNFVRCYDKWLVGDPSSGRVGYFDNTLSSHWGDLIGWDFGTVIIYNKGMGAVFHRLELVCLTGRAILGDESTIWASYSLDGETFSQEIGVSAGMQGERNKRIVWLQNGTMQQWRIQKFRGTSDAFISIARLEAEIEGLNV